MQNLYDCVLALAIHCFMFSVLVCHLSLVLVFSAFCNCSLRQCSFVVVDPILRVRLHYFECIVCLPVFAFAFEII